MREVLSQQQSTRQDTSELRFSIIVTCYNQREYIEDAVESVLAQRHSSMEVIVVDDGSQDGSLELLRQYGASIELISLASNRGAIEARNRGAAAARGEYLIFLDGDDLFTPWALDVYDLLIAERGPVTIVSGGRWFSGSVPLLRRDDVPQKLEFVEYDGLMARDRQHGWLTGAFVVCRRAFQDVGGWTPEIFHLDLMDLAAKLGYSGNSILVCAPYTMLYRMHAENSVHFVPPFLRSIYLMMNRERAGRYPGGRQRQFERHAFQGGMIFCWMTKALRAGLYGPALRLLIHGRAMIAAAVSRKLWIKLRGRRRLEVRQLKSIEPSLRAVAPALPRN